MLTPEEKKWLKRVQRALDACPSDTIGFYTIGDHGISVYRKPKHGDLESDDPRNASDFCQMVDRANASLGYLEFTSVVHSTAG